MKNKKIVFTSNRTGNEDIFSMNIDGTELIQLTDLPGQNNSPAVSPDGKKIAYTSDINGTWQIMVMDWNGKNKKQITNNPWRSGYPAWSFDGRNIKRISSTNMRKRVPAVSAYGEIIVFSDNESLYTMDSKGENIKKISGDLSGCRHSDISPDNKYITFESTIDGQEEIFIIKLDG